MTFTISKHHCLTNNNPVTFRPFHKSLCLDTWSERWCVLGFFFFFPFLCFIHISTSWKLFIMRTLVSDRCSRINQPLLTCKARVWAGLWSLAITTCWNPTIIEIYWIASHQNQKKCYSIEICTGNHKAAVKSTKGMASGMHECVQWNRSIYHFSDESLKLFQQVINNITSGALIIISNYFHNQSNHFFWFLSLDIFKRFLQQSMEAIVLLIIRILKEQRE